MAGAGEPQTAAAGVEEQIGDGEEAVETLDRIQEVEASQNLGRHDGGAVALLVAKPAAGELMTDRDAHQRRRNAMAGDVRHVDGRHVIAQVQGVEDVAADTGARLVAPGDVQRPGGACRHRQQGALDLGRGTQIRLQLSALPDQFRVGVLQRPGQPTQPQLGLDALENLPPVEGLGHVIGRSQFEPSDLLSRLVHGGEEDDRHVGGARIVLQRAADRESIEHRHVDVEQDQSGRFFDRPRDALRSIGRLVDIESLAREDALEQPPIDTTVVDNENAVDEVLSYLQCAQQTVVAAESSSINRDSISRK